jgi:starch phosphorylase
MSPQALLSDLTRLASNYRWTWASVTQTLFRDLPGHDEGLHPVGIVAALDDETIRALAGDDGFVARVRDEVDELDTLLAGSVEPRIAYCSPEFGLSALLPQYAGGLGVLAGDHLKTASDLGTPLAGVGLFYREGVFRQVLTGGTQTEEYGVIDPKAVGAEDTGVRVSVPFPGREVQARVWRIMVGRVPLLLLDADVEENTESDRTITDRLYAGSREHRLDQEMILGIGGARALDAMGWDIRLHHLNEGHAGFLLFELIDRIHDRLTLEEARDRIRPGITFTTHTPVPAGIDCFHVDLLRPYFETWARRWGCSVESLWEMGVDPEDPSIFNMAALCLRNAASANGVSSLHGEVSRKLFAGVGIGDEIGHVTNGVHARTWTAPHFQRLFDEVLGTGWADGEESAWRKVTDIDDRSLSSARAAASRALTELVEARTGATVDPDRLIFGFARRFAPYKRASLLLRRPEALEELLSRDDRPVHFVFAGKAHPSDENGKALVADLLAAAGSDRFGGRITFIPDYDMSVALAMVQGCDVWLNNPIRPREASGTSGEKAVLNGVLNCSILDGWWAEMCDGRNGWEISASEADDPDRRDDEEAVSMMATLEGIAVEYHRARPVFLGRIRHAWSSLGPRVTAARMLRDYTDSVYTPSAAGGGQARGDV